MSQLILFNKPFQVMSQFSRSGEKQTLADYIKQTGIYPAGRLDYDSEGLLLLTDDGRLQHEISHPGRKMAKTYWAQVEGTVTSDALAKLRRGIMLNDGNTLPAQAEHLPPPDIWDRHPPIRHRASIPTDWLALTIIEGRNRQVRRMTAAVGLPTLRLVRVTIGPWALDNLEPGTWRRLQVDLRPSQPKPGPPKRGHGRSMRGDRPV